MLKNHLLSNRDLSNGNLNFFFLKKNQIKKKKKKKKIKNIFL